MRLDAIRGLAIFGILFVNIWSFVWGAGYLRYGILPEGAPLADRAAVFLTALLAEQKSYPVLAFLFGAGFALHAVSLKRKAGNWIAARRIFRRRPRWLLAAGVLHGSLVWYGDILTLYGVAGFFLARTTGARLAILLKSLGCWALAALAVIVLFSLPVNARLPERVVVDASDIQEIRAIKAINTQGTVGGFLRKRLGDYADNVAAMVFYVPNVMVLFLLGTLSVRLGWLTRQWRHVRFWRLVRRGGFVIGLPLNLVWAGMALAEALDPFHPPAAMQFMNGVMMFAGPCLAAAYVASLMLAGERTIAWLAAWLAPAGRMALSNYLLQSLLCLLLLQTLGLGLGATLAPAHLSLLAAGIMVLQILGSRWWLARHRQGPLEVLYRRYADR